MPSWLLAIDLDDVGGPFRDSPVLVLLAPFFVPGSGARWYSMFEPLDVNRNTFEMKDERHDEKDTSTGTPYSTPP